MLKKYHLLTFGCQMNVSDSQRIESKLNELGYHPASEKEAGLIVVNACSVRQHAVDRIWGKLKKWALLGQKQILITGCILKEDKNKFKVRNVQTFEITKLNHLENIIKSLEFSKNIDSLDYFEVLPQQTGKIAYISIMTGCDNFCSYCVVPYTRGREISRSVEDIIREVKIVLDQGFKEIMLLGQNVNSYGKSRKSKVHKVYKDNAKFIKLLKTIDSLPNDFKFNFMSSNPQDMSDELVSCYANLKKWPRELHLAMQSGDDEILKKMNRKYTVDQFEKLIGKLKVQIPNIKLSTDIIVGFPGETSKQFENTFKICQKIGFYKAYIFKYSSRAGTVSAKMLDDVSDLEKKKRFEKLDQLINK